MLKCWQMGILNLNVEECLIGFKCLKHSKESLLLHLYFFHILYIQDYSIKKHYSLYCGVVNASMLTLFMTGRLEVIMCTGLN